MTDRYNAYIVILEKDIREDDAQETIKAIQQIKGVLKVKPNVSGIEADIAKSRAIAEIAKKLQGALGDL